MKTATEVPLETAERAAQALSAATRLIQYANMNAISDLETAIGAAYAAFLGALANVRINIAEIKDTEYGKSIQGKLAELQKGVERAQKEAYTGLASRGKE